MLPERFDYWNGVICEAVLNVEAAPRLSRDFRAELSANQYELGHFVRFSSEPHEIMRSPKLLRAKPDDSYLVSLQLAGRCRVEQGETRFALDPGDIGIVSAARPMHLAFEGDVRRMVAVLPRRAVEGACAWLTPGVAARLPKDRAVTRMLGRLIAELSDPEAELAAGEEAALSRALLDFMANSCEMPAARHDTPLEAQLIAYLTRNLDDPALSPIAAAAALGIAERTVHAQFSRRGTTCMRWIMAQRLERAAAALREPSWAGVSVSEIAYRSGFNDVAHFSRRFKEAYGSSPSAYRSMAS